LEVVTLHNESVCYLLLDFKQAFFINFSHFITLWLQSHKNGKCEPMHMIVYQAHILVRPIDPDQY
jgi:penicillin-binding protein-related factor A (putative recombinase)